MIDAKNLRLGNWINEQGLELQVGMINSELFKAAEPILITDHWLAKFGYFKDGLEGNYYNDHPKMQVNPMYRRGRHFGFNGTFLSMREIHYIHELQNQFYAMFGIELEFIDENLFVEYSGMYIRKKDLHKYDGSDR